MGQYHALYEPIAAGNFVESASFNRSDVNEPAATSRPQSPAHPTGTQGGSENTASRRWPCFSLADLIARQNAQQELDRWAQPQLKRLSEAFETVPHTAFLTDAAGITLLAIGNRVEADQLELVAGCCWLDAPSAAVAGPTVAQQATTTESQHTLEPSAIAQVLRDPATSFAEVEHAAGLLVGFTTLAAPLADHGRLVGAIGVCLPCGEVSPQRRLLVEYAAAAIEKAWHGQPPVAVPSDESSLAGWQVGDSFWFNRTLLELLPVAVYVCDAAGAIQYYNHRAVQLWGREPKLGENGDHYCASYRAFTPDGTQITRLQSPMAAVLENGEPLHNIEASVVRPDGSRVFVIVNVQPIRDKQGQLLGAVNVLQDISDRLQAENAKGLLAAIVESSDDAIISKSFDGYITSWNSGAERLYGYTAEEALGKPVAMLCTAEGAKEISHILEQVRASQQLRHYETTRVRKGGALADVSVTVSPVKNAAGEIVGASAIARDITEQKRLERERRANEERLQMALESGRMGTWDWDVRQDRMIWSPGLEALHGLKPGTFPGTFEAFQADIHPQDRKRVVREILDTLKTGREYRNEYRLVRPDGTVHWVEARGRAIRNDRGEPIHMMGICMEVTERKRIEHDLRFLADASRSLASLKDWQSTLQSIAQMAVPHFADWCVVYMNGENGQPEPFALSHADPSKRTVAEDLHQRFPPQLDPATGIYRAIHSGESMLVPLVDDAMLQKHAHGAEHLEILRGLGLKSYVCVPLSIRDRVIGAMLFVSAESGRRYDATDLSVAEDLAHRVAVTIENAWLYEESQENARRKDEFLAMLAHELRNPLAPVRSGLDVLRLRLGENETIALMQEQVEHLVRLVDDLLDVSRIMRGKVQLRSDEVDLRGLASRAVETVRSFVQSQRHHLTVSMPDEPVWVRGDAVRLTQVLTNLLHNAAKYTEPGGRIWLTIEPDARSAVITVRDTGIGISKTLLPHVFELFTQADQSLERSQGGLGIGLTLVRNLVELHGGNVSASSPGENQGSEFVVRLPLVPAPAKSETSPNLSDQVPPGRRVLIVDDNHAAARMLSLLLKSMGIHEVRCEGDGPSGLKAVNEFQPDLVLLDIGLPGMDGYEVAKILRRDPCNDHLLLVALTGYGQPEDRRHSKDLGFDEHLVKPLAMDNVRQLLRHPKIQAR